MMANKVIKPVLLGNAARHVIRNYTIESRALQVSYNEKPKPAPPFTIIQFKNDPIFSERLDTLYLDQKSDNPVILRTVVDLTEDRDSSLIDLQYGSRDTRVNVPEASSLSSFSHTVLEFSTKLKQNLDAHEPSDETPKKQPLPNLDGKPSPDQLLQVYDILQRTLPKLFTQSLDYSIYSQDVVVVDNIRGKTFNGIGNLVRQLSYLRVYGHLKYAYVTFELVSMHQVPNEGRITVRWRIKGISGFRTMLKFWQYKLWEWRKAMSTYEVWNDGIAHFDVGADGKVYKITVDKMEEERNIEKQSTLDRLIKLKQKAVA